MENELNIIRGNLKEYDNAKMSYNYCVSKIMEYKKNKEFYIGATHEPVERLNTHYNEKGIKNMYLLCKVPTRSKTIKLEQKLIDRFNTKKSLNQGGGGEGIRDDINYIYLLLR